MCLSVQTVSRLWQQHKDSGAFQAIVAQEFDKALATPFSEVMQNEAEVHIYDSWYCMSIDIISAVLLFDLAVCMMPA